jgi:isocitrate dehydrogenase
MFETGAGGSAPTHVQQLQEENHLRWDSLGEFMAIAVSLEDVGFKYQNKKAMILARTLDEATGRLLDTNKGPSPKAGQLDNRGSHFYLALYWAQALGGDLGVSEEQVLAELNGVQGESVDLGGYYFVDRGKADEVMRPSRTFNEIIDQL